MKKNSGKFHSVGLPVFVFLAVMLNLPACSAPEKKRPFPVYSRTSAFENPEKLKAGVVKIIVPNSKQGTGFIVKIKQDRVFVVTAYHVVKKAGERFVQFYGDAGKFPSEVLRVDKKEDIAVLEVVGGSQKIPRDLAELKLGTIFRTDEGGHATVVGIPGMLNRWIADRCKILAISNRITFAGEGVSQASSGSPIIKNNRVIGMFKAMQNPFRFAVRSDRIINILHESGVCSDSETPDPTAPAEMSESQLFAMLPVASSRYDREQWICHNKLNDFRVEFDSHVNRRNRVMLDLEDLDAIRGANKMSAKNSRLRSELNVLVQKSMQLESRANYLWKEWRLACGAFDEQTKSVAQTVLKELSLRLEANAREDHDLANRL